MEFERKWKREKESNALVRRLEPKCPPFAA
jgi:hypothetical protein